MPPHVMVSLNDVRVLLREYVKKNSKIGLFIENLTNDGYITLSATTGTPPLVVSSTSLVSNLNAEYLDGHPASDFVTVYDTVSGLTNEAIDDRVSDLLQNTSAVTWTYDDDAGTITPSISHAGLTGLGGDHHTQYARVDGARNFTENQTFNKNITVTQKANVGSLQMASGAATGRVLTSDATGNATWQASTTTSHGSLTGLSADDHTIYARTDGTRAITGPQTFNSSISVTGQATVGSFRMAAGASAGYTLVCDGAGYGTWTAVSNDHGGLGGLLDDDHSQYVMGDGRSGGQTIDGGTGSGENLVLRSTGHATKGKIYIGGSTNYDEITSTLDIVGTLNASKFVLPSGAVDGYVLTSDDEGNASWAELTLDTKADIDNPVFTTGITTPALKVTTSPTNGYVLTSDADGNATWAANTGGSSVVAGSGIVISQDGTEYTINATAQDSGGLSVGGSITGGTANRLLFEDNSNLLGESSDLIWDGSTLFSPGVSSVGTDDFYVSTPETSTGSTTTGDIVISTGNNNATTDKKGSGRSGSIVLNVGDVYNPETGTQLYGSIDISRGGTTYAKFGPTFKLSGTEYNQDPTLSINDITGFDGTLTIHGIDDADSQEADTPDSLILRGGWQGSTAYFPGSITISGCTGYFGTHAGEWDEPAPLTIEGGWDPAHGMNTGGPGGHVRIFGGKGIITGNATAEGGDVFIRSGITPSGLSGDVILEIGNGTELGEIKIRAAQTLVGKYTENGLTLPLGASDGYVLTSDSDGNATWESAEFGSMAIGGDVAGGVNSSLLFINASGQLAQNNHITVYSTPNYTNLNVDGTISSATLQTGALVPLDNIQYVQGDIHCSGFLMNDGNQANGYVLTSDTDGNATWEADYRNIRLLLDNGGTTITTGRKWAYTKVPWDCEIDKWSVMTIPSGTVQLDVLKADEEHPSQATSITAGDYAETVGGDTFSAIPSGWTTSLTEGDVIDVNVVACDTPTKIFLDLKVRKS